jgi:O-succinylbenzoic acid--CoA ligase
VPRLLRAVDLAALATRSPELALTAIADALDGRGDALLPVGPDPAERAALDALEPGRPLRENEDDDTDPTALVLATSGSTGVPKGALLPASALRASAEATARRLGGPARWLLALAPHHVAGVQVLVRSLLAGTVPEVLDLSAGFDVDAFARAAGALHGRRCTALVPTQLVRLLDTGGEPLAALTAFDAVLVGGAATPPALLERARASGVRVTTTYGMSETAGGCVYDGVPLDGVRVRLDDAGPDGAGRVLLGGPVVARGYRLRAGHSAFSTADGTRWFATDDLGVLAAQRLQVRGRADDVIVTGGVKVAPQIVEEVVATVPGVRECLVVGVPDAEWGERVEVLVVAGAPVPVLADVRRAVAERLGAAAAPRALHLVDAIPLRGLGKPDRAAAQRVAQALAEE